MARLKTIEWVNDAVQIIDQTRLPVELSYTKIDNEITMFEAIRSLQVRGAPAIGIAAAYGLYLAIRNFDKQDTVAFFDLLNEKADYLASSRPTAVNLFWALNRMKAKAQSLASESVSSIKKALLEEAHSIYEEDRATGRAIGEAGYSLIKSFSTILTHCNAGGLATAEFGTALAPIYIGAEHGKIFHVYADETRPLLQGSRITAFELHQAGIPVTVICDNMAAFVMSRKKIDAVIVGADRITANGDAANKIGTYGLSIIAKAHHVPFYVAAPFSTFDLSLETGMEIPIEERSADEVIFGFGKYTSPEDVKVYNPAFDVTPAENIAAFITDKGVIYPPYTKNLRNAFAK